MYEEKTASFLHDVWSDNGCGVGFGFVQVNKGKVERAVVEYLLTVVMVDDEEIPSAGLL
ncbi:hypothetical protein [Bacillus weihaiensis]|uniref:hypothetical protein n=1 Tax=Bacillus weihaiensis TaxID=1547283 RepID=UPI001314F643|nr:hypothetical protein [Bacillus weihaiensis]